MVSVVLPLLFMRRSAFTLIEMLIVLLVIGILMAIAVPQWMSARETSRRSTCLMNIRQVESAKEQYTMEAKLTNGDPVIMDNLWPEYIKGAAAPHCPIAGVYTVGPVGTPSACSIHGSVN